MEVKNLGFYLHTYAEVQCACTQISNSDTYYLKDQGARVDCFGCLTYLDVQNGD